MKTVFVAGPYGSYKKKSGEIVTTEQNIKNCEAACKKIVEKNMAVICPNISYNFLVENEDNFYEKNYRLILKQTKKLLSICDIVYFSEGWDYSYGCLEERRLAQRLNKRIIYFGEEIE
jgi:hypothetical protein